MPGPARQTWRPHLSERRGVEAPGSGGRRRPRRPWPPVHTHRCQGVGTPSWVRWPMDTPRKVRYSLRPIGFIRSSLKEAGRAPRQGSEGAPDAWLEVEPWAAEALQGLAAGANILVF